MEYESILVEDEENKSSLTRHDYCKNCWDLSPKDKITTQWRGKTQNKKIPISDSQDKSARAMELLRFDLTCDGFELENEVFILALFLARKRQLILRQELPKEGFLYFLYEAPATGEIFTVKKVDLSQLQIEEIQQKLAKKLLEIPSSMDERLCQ
jgi:hypothetical protein